MGEKEDWTKLQNNKGEIIRGSLSAHAVNVSRNLGSRLGSSDPSVRRSDHTEGDQKPENQSGRAGIQHLDRHADERRLYSLRKRAIHDSVRLAHT